MSHPLTGCLLAPPLRLARPRRNLRSHPGPPLPGRLALRRAHTRRAGRATRARRRPVLPARPVLVRNLPAPPGGHTGPPRPAASYPAARPGRAGARARASRARLARLPALAGQQAAPRELPRLPRHPPDRSLPVPSRRTVVPRRPRRHHRPGPARGLVVRRAAAVPGVAAGPSGLVLIDIDTHHDELPPNLATGLLPGIDLAAEPIPRQLWADPARFRDGRDSLRLLAALRGGPAPWPPGDGTGRSPWPPRPADGTCGTRHPPPGSARPSATPQAATAWPGRSTSKPAGPTAWPPERPPARAPTRSPAATPPPRAHARLARPRGHPCHRAPARPTPAGPRTPSPPGRSGAAYLTTVINRGAARIAAMDDGRKRALAALAYQAGGLLAWSGLPEHEVTGQLTDAAPPAASPPPPPGASSPALSPTGSPSPSPHHPAASPVGLIHPSYVGGSGDRDAGTGPPSQGGAAHHDRQGHPREPIRRGSCRSPGPRLHPCPRSTFRMTLPKPSTARSGG